MSSSPSDLVNNVTATTLKHLAAWVHTRVTNEHQGEFLSFVLRRLQEDHIYWTRLGWRVLYNNFKAAKGV